MGNLIGMSLLLLKEPETDPLKEKASPRNHEEELLVNIWNSLLGVKNVSIEDNFFSRGGHSLLATQVVSRIRDVFHIELPLRSIFEAPTISELAFIVKKYQISEEDAVLKQMLDEIENLTDEEVLKKI